MRGLLCRLRFGVVACLLVALLEWGSPLGPSAVVTQPGRPLRSDVQRAGTGPPQDRRPAPSSWGGRPAQREWPEASNMRMHWGFAHLPKPRAIESDTVAGKAVVAGLLFLGALSCWTQGPSSFKDRLKHDYESIPGGGASEGHHLHFVEGRHPNYGTLQRAHREVAHVTAAPDFPSGMWYGYYNHGSPVPNPFAICLHFSRGRITDVGEDVIGQFQVTGRYSSRTLRVAFSKQYVFGTGSTPRNEGQLLEYRGARAPGLGQGLRGTWHMRTSRVHIDGNFHIWPVMPGWNPHPPRFQPLPPMPIPAKVVHSGVRIVKVKRRLSIAPGQHCALCVRRPIAAVLVPCGHIAFCLPCVRELGSASAAFCPICQLPITQVHIEAVLPHPKKEASPAVGQKLLPAKELAKANGLRRGREPRKHPHNLTYHSPRILSSSAS